MAGGTLQDLCTLVMYVDATGTHTTEVYFKGRLEPFEVIETGILFGDLLSVSIDAQEFVNFVEADLFENHLKAYITNLNKFEAADISKVIVECYGEMSCGDYELYKATSDYLSTCRLNGIEICKLTWDIFLATYNLELPQNHLIVRGIPSVADDDNNRMLTSAETRFLNTSDPYILVPDKNRAFVYNVSCEREYATEYLCDIYGEIVFSLLNQIMRDGFMLKKCEQCNRWFIPTKADEKYCTRTYNGISCKQKAIQEKRQVRLKYDLIGKAYNNVSTNLKNRVNASTISDDERFRRKKALECFKAEYKNRKIDYKAGNLSEEKFLYWINSQKTEVGVLKGKA